MLGLTRRYFIPVVWIHTADTKIPRSHALKEKEPWLSVLKTLSYLCNVGRSAFPSIQVFLILGEQQSRDFLGFCCSTVITIQALKKLLLQPHHHFPSELPRICFVCLLLLFLTPPTKCKAPSSVHTLSAALLPMTQLRPLHWKPLLWFPHTILTCSSKLCAEGTHSCTSGFSSGMC